jgi:hypothetical protein
MKLWAWIVARRRRKAHERYLQERARQRALTGIDAQQEIRDVSVGSAAAQQGMFGHGSG